MINKLPRFPFSMTTGAPVKNLVRWSSNHPIIISFAICALTSCVIGSAYNRTIVLNMSPSVQPGLYVRTCESPTIGSLIDFRIPILLQRYIQLRTGDSGEKWFIIKPIIAGPGDEVDTTSNQLVINGQVVATISTHDADGRELPVWRSHRKLGADEYFVYSSRIPNSLDSRCYGPICRRDIDGVRRCIFAWGG